MSSVSMSTGRSTASAWPSRSCAHIGVGRGPGDLDSRPRGKHGEGPLLGGQDGHRRPTPPPDPWRGMTSMSTCWPRLPTPGCPGQPVLRQPSGAQPRHGRGCDAVLWSRSPATCSPPPARRWLAGPTRYEQVAAWRDGPWSNPAALETMARPLPIPCWAASPARGWPLRRRPRDRAPAPGPAGTTGTTNRGGDR
jgi:hypothetical protein